ncbi:MAG: class I SAM-dependent methyltransferase [Acidimicrobiales bacterium]
MQDEHGFIWKAMLDTIDTDLRGSRVLDVGCNRGGFLRLLVAAANIAEGYGYDPAPGAIADARRLAAEMPLTFEVAHNVPEGWGQFDVAFSHEVLYLLDDLPAHAADLFGVLRPGGSYFAVMGVHAASPMMSSWHAHNAAELGLPRLYALDEVARDFEHAGFSVSVANLKLGFVPVSAHRHGHDHTSDLWDWMDYYSREKVLLRFTRHSP